MFTGIVDGKATITNVVQNGSISTFSIDLEGFTEGLEIGASVAIDGVCMTVVSLDGCIAKFDAIEETLGKSTMGNKETGDIVNIERSLKLGDELGGHILSGHILTKARIMARDHVDDGISLVLENPDSCRPFILEKGYIAVDGMSLTVGEVLEDVFHLYIIPETIRVTTIGDKQVGQEVNIEVDSRTQAIVETMMRMGENK